MALADCTWSASAQSVRRYELASQRNLEDLHDSVESPQGLPTEYNVCLVGFLLQQTGGVEIPQHRGDVGVFCLEFGSFIGVTNKCAN